MRHLLTKAQLYLVTQGRYQYRVGGTSKLLVNTKTDFALPPKNLMAPTSMSKVVLNFESPEPIFEKIFSFIPHVKGLGA